MDLSDSQAQEFLICAKLDIRACRLLYDQELFSNAVFHLQQATEKAVKAYMLTQKVSLKQMRSHDFMKWIKAQNQLVEKKYKNAKRLDNLESLDKTISKAESKLARASYEDMHGFFVFAKKGGIKSLPIISQGKLDEEENLAYATLFALLTTLCMYTGPHEQSTRYPDCSIKPWHYNLELGIVRAIPDFLNVIDRLISGLEFIIKRDSIEK
jgi:HEPN domain-containing protein